MRVRIIEQSLNALRHYYSKLLSRRWTYLGFQLVSHKWLRYCPYFLVLAYGSNSCY